MKRPSTKFRVSSREARILVRDRAMNPKLHLRSMRYGTTRHK